MADSRQIECINKDHRQDRHHAITHVGGNKPSRWKLTLADAIAIIERKDTTFHTLGGGITAGVEVATHSGRKYLKTMADRDTPDNLLSLPECP